MEFGEEGRRVLEGRGGGLMMMLCQLGERGRGGS